MRIVWAANVSLLATVGGICAAPVNPLPSRITQVSPDHALHAEAETYANNIKAIILGIEQAYVRPVSLVDLYEAALVGLYEAAREPLPARLRADIKREVDADILGLLTRTREGLGNVDALRGHRSLMLSLQALPRVLDPYCGMTARREFQRLDLNEGTPNTGLEFVGVPLAPAPPVVAPGGLRIVPNETVPTVPQSGTPAGPLQVQHVQAGSPGQKAGIRPGDLITRINDLPPEAAGFPALFQRLRPHQSGMPFNPADPPLRLTVLRPGRNEPFEVSVTPAMYRPESVFGAHRKRDGSWDYMLDPTERIGYIRVGGIRSECRQEVREALESLRGSSVRGLVFDLRWCPGGYLEEATSIARLLLPPDKVPIASQRERKGKRDDGTWEYAVTPVKFDRDLGEPYTQFPMIVLVNGETSGGGELIAAALQDYGRAAVAGQRTVGKTSVQKQPERLGIAFKLTVGTFIRPAALQMQRLPDNGPSEDWCIRPDPGRELPLTAAANRRLKTWCEISTLRPAGSAEALPLDDPENDPQRHAAVEMLKEMIKK
jgi:C-terminal peptidase prc